MINIFFKKRCTGKEPCIFPLVDHLVQELTSRLLSQENRFLRQYLVPAKLNAFNSGVQDRLYETYNRSFKEERLWQWNFNVANKVVSFNWWKTSDTSHRDSLQLANPDLYPNVITIIAILLTMPVSNATLKRSFSTMRRVKTFLRSTIKTERLAALALIQAYKDIPINVEAVIREFCSKKNRRLAFEFLWAPPRFQICLQLLCR